MSAPRYQDKACPQCGAVLEAGSPGWAKGACVGECPASAVSGQASGRASGPSTVRVFAIIKGSSEEAVSAAAAHGLAEAGRPEPQAGRLFDSSVTRLWLEHVPGMERTLARWMSEQTQAPFPSGTLLWYRLDTVGQGGEVRS